MYSRLQAVLLLESVDCRFAHWQLTNLAKSQTLHEVRERRNDALDGDLIRYVDLQ